MRRPCGFLTCIAALALIACEGDNKGIQGQSHESPSPTRSPADPPPSGAYHDASPTADGIGRTYFGREIAQVMGHSAIDWLERSGRASHEHTDALLKLLNLNDGLDVADIGAGSGYFTLPIARAIAPSGKIYAVDIQQEMLDFLVARAHSGNVSNIVAILGSVDDISLPNESVDLVLLVDAYHEFDHPWEMARSIRRALRVGGRVALVEYRAEDPLVEIKPLHKMSESQARLEWTAAGFEFERNDSTLPMQHLLWFRKTSP